MRVWEKRVWSLCVEKMDIAAEAMRVWEKRVWSLCVEKMDIAAEAMRVWKKMDVAAEAMHVWKKDGRSRWNYMCASANCVIIRCDSPIANFSCIVTTLNPNHIMTSYNMVLGYEWD